MDVPGMCQGNDNVAPILTIRVPKSTRKVESNFRHVTILEGRRPG